MNHLIDKVFAEHKCSPYDVIARTKKCEASLFSVKVLELLFNSLFIVSAS